jgi:SAM-dependent methyltransferase
MTALKNALEKWVEDLLVHPVSKLPLNKSQFRNVDGYIDARIFLKNSLNFNEWSSGQIQYENWESKGGWNSNDVSMYLNEVKIDSLVYDKYRMTGRILDVGGGVGTVREYLDSSVQYLSVDPFIQVFNTVPSGKRLVYKCLKTPCNFIAGVAEFLPLQSSSFDWVHMRSMLDHVQVPDLALLEAWRVLRDDGNLLIGMYVEGGKSGKLSSKELLKELFSSLITFFKINSKYKDHHTWHPTFINLQKLIETNGFEIIDIFWQPGWADRVVYINARKTKSL